MSTNCTSCLNTAARYLLNGSCLCSVGYVDIYFNGTCSICHYSCQTCNGISANNCTNCTTNRILNVSSCVCPTGYFDNGSQTCQTCASTCLSCNNALNSSCTACNAIYLRTLSASPAGSCQCLPGYYDAGVLLCASCNIKCITCVSIISCSSCDSITNHRALDASGMCVCASGYY